MNWILALQVLTTFYMFGLIWFVQVVHYPLMGSVGEAFFVAYERKHTILTTYVVMPAMLIELGTAGLLLIQAPKDPVWWANAIGVGLIWASTFFIQVPLHGQLSEQFSESAHLQLVQSNWIRTVLWTLRSGLLVYVLFQIFK